MNILITGAAGFVGRNLVENLKNIRDGKNRTRPNIHIEKIYEYDINNTAENLDLFCSNCDFVFNLAGVNRPKDPAEFRAGNFGFASQLLATLKKHNNKCPVMLSSSIQATLAGRFGTSEYGLSKRDGEELFFRYAEETGATVYVYRFPNLAGKWCKPNYNSAVATFCHNIANDLPITVNDPNVELELLFIDDLLEEMYDCIEGKPHHCDYPRQGEILEGVEYNGLTPLWTNEGRYCGCPVTHKATLGRIVELLRAFHDQPNTLIMPAIPANSLEKKLYSMYLSYLPKEKIAFDLKTNVDNRGSFTELLKTLDHGQFSVNISKPGITKGQHWHNSKWEFFIVVAGHGLIQERKIGTNEIIEFEVSGDNIQAVHMLPGYAHNIINLSENENLVTLMWANEVFDPEKPETYYEQVYYQELLDKSIREIEKVVDSYHLSLEYLNKPFQQAILDVLRVFENSIQAIDSLYQFTNFVPAHDEAKKRIIDALNMALRWIYEKNFEANKSFSYDFSDCEYKKTHDFLFKYALKYLQVCDAYISYSRKRFSLDAIAGKNIFFTVPANQETAFKAEMSNFLDQQILLDQYVNKLQQVTDAHKDIIGRSSISNCFDDNGICQDKEAIKAFLDIADFHWTETSILPKNWRFNDFSLEDYRLCWRELFAIAFLYKNRLSYMITQKSSRALTHNIIVQKRENLVKYLLQQTHLDENTINSIISMIVFNYKLKRSNLIEQPLVSINDWIFIVPSLFINSDKPERNLITLIQRLNRDYKHFDEVNKLEGLMRSQIEEHIHEDKYLKLCHDIDIRDEMGTSTDVDFGIFDMKSNAVMICELKWLIESEATADVYAREDDVDHGCKQIETAMGYAMCNGKAFVKQAFNVDVDAPIKFFCCVITKTNVRNNSKTVPVINQRKFIEMLENKTSFVDMFEKIRNMYYQNPLSKNIKIKRSILDYAGYLFRVPSVTIPAEANFKSYR